MNISQQLNLEKLHKIINNPLIYRQEFLILLFIVITLVLILVIFFSLLVLRSPRVKVKWQTSSDKKSIPVLLLILSLLFLFLVLLIPTSSYLANDRFCLSCHRFANWNQFSHKKQGCHSCHVRFGWFGAFANSVGMGAKLLNKYVTVGKVNTPVYEANCWQCHQNKVKQTLIYNIKKVRHKNLLDFSCLSCHKELRHK